MYLLHICLTHPGGTFTYTHKYTYTHTKRYILPTLALIAKITLQTISPSKEKWKNPGIFPKGNII
jgi:hypothetical protein